MCVLPGSTLNGGEWVAPSASPVVCSTSPVFCNTVSSPANISFYKNENQALSASDDGWYKCCLPTSCSDPNTNMITANIFSKCSHCTSTHCHLLLIYCIGWAQIEGITVDLPSDITVLPQSYTLHAIKVGDQYRGYLRAANWYYESGSTIVLNSAVDKIMHTVVVLVVEII